jgi:hypothetical protein
MEESMIRILIFSIFLAAPTLSNFAHAETCSLEGFQFGLNPERPLVIEGERTTIDNDGSIRKILPNSIGFYFKYANNSQCDVTVHSIRFTFTWNQGGKAYSKTVILDPGSHTSSSGVPRSVIASIPRGTAEVLSLEEWVIGDLGKNDSLVYNVEAQLIGLSSDQRLDYSFKFVTQ